MDPTEKMDDTALRLLKQYWGYEAFRPLQLETIRAVCAGQDTLVLMPTGGGKSILYQIPALAQEGVCIVVTPLIALMKDQIDKLRSRRILAEAIHSGMRARDIDRILDNCIYGSVKFLYIAPERIDSDLFRVRFAKMRVSLLAVDEAHCISQWGYDFRPAYLQIARLRALQPEMPVLALTASATPDVATDIMEHLQFAKPHILRMSFARPNLSYVVRHTEDKHGQLLRILAQVPGSAIVYVRTREKAETLAQFLQEKELSAAFYHGGMSYGMRSIRQDDWIRGVVRVMVATNAFGMGIDKADVRVVIHYDLCDSLEAYYQEAGRAGRDGARAYAVILLAEGDPEGALRRLQLGFPPLDKIAEIYEALGNFLGVAIGDGKGMATVFNVYDFAAKFHYFVPTVLNAIAILQQNGYLILTDEMDNPARLRFIVPRDELYRIRVNRKALDHLITLLLRRNTGLFSSFVSIDEAELVHLSGYTPEHLHELLKTLWQLRIIRYIPGSKSPMLILSEERLPTENLRISPESYARRKECAERRIQSMFDYLHPHDTCRSVLIQRYFGEQTARPCGVCDICIAQRKHDASPSHPLRRQILDQLTAEPLTIRELTSRIAGNPQQILAEVTRLLEERRIEECATGRLQWIPSQKPSPKS
ncbi:MAG: RecQ family ATP-dependent DNA helicase [Alistipes sp.]|nr:RecQ family ATP-dependent DNA helicase [Alistipes sp.]